MIRFTDIVKACLFAMLGVGCTSCDKDTEFAELSFVGDSIIARWDLQASFPSSATYNYGVPGSGIEYLKSLSGKFVGKTLVIISGTNDVPYLAPDPDVLTTRYAESYVDAIEALGAKEVYLYCVLPRGERFNGSIFNPVIIQLNAKVQAIVTHDHPSIHYLDVYDALAYNGFLSPYYTTDGLHLNIYGYEVLREWIMDNG